MDTQSSAFTRNLASFVGLLMASALATAAEDPTAVTLYVANNAVHNGTGCGSLERPCRSISQAIANAVDGSLIEVGPGIYGDIDGDGDASGVGEEALDAFGGLVTIDKPLVVYSKAGAAQTVIRAPLAFFRAIVLIDPFGVHDVTFGRPNGGFTIVGTGSDRPVGGFAAGVDVRGANITIAGNIVSDTQGGFLVDTGAGSIDLLGNVATRNGFGFAVRRASFGVGRARLEGNIAADNESFGISVGDPGVVMNNLATRNRTGFSFCCGGLTITGNVAVANTQFGIESRVSGELIGNAVIGNGIAGFRLFSFPGESCSAVVLRSNIFGNGEAATGCGLISEGCFVVATDNYWGKPNGPGPNPGDRAHKDCGANTTTSPFSPVPFPIEGPSTDLEVVE
jgi:hypothetical protein